MKITAAIASTAVIMAASIPGADAHGYILVPQSQFKGAANSAWSVQIDPVWKSNQWYGNTAKSVQVFNSLKGSHNYKDLRTLLDNTAVYGPNCGYTNPNGTPQPIPTNGKAIFSRGLIHTGPCEIWLDNKKVMAADDCYSKYGHSNVNVKTEFPVDYSYCKGEGRLHDAFLLAGVPGPRKEDRVADLQGLHPSEGVGFVEINVGAHTVCSCQAAYTKSSKQAEAFYGDRADNTPCSQLWNATDPTC